MNKQDLKYFKKQLKQGYRITMIYDEIASTGEIATTHSSYKAFKYDVKRLAKEGIRYSIRVESPIRDIITNIREIAGKLRARGYKTLANQLDEQANALVIYA